MHAVEYQRAVGIGRRQSRCARSAVLVDQNLPPARCTVSSAIPMLAVDRRLPLARTRPTNRAVLCVLRRCPQPKRTDCAVGGGGQQKRAGGNDSSAEHTRETAVPQRTDGGAANAPNSTSIESHYTALKQICIACYVAYLMHECCRCPSPNSAAALSRPHRAAVCHASRRPSPKVPNRLLLPPIPPSFCRRPTSHRPHARLSAECAQSRGPMRSLRVVRPTQSSCHSRALRPARMPCTPGLRAHGGKGAWLVSRAWKVLYGEPASLQITRRTAREKFQHRFPLDLASDICIAPSGEVRRKDVNPARHAAYGGWNGTLGAGCGLRGGWNGEQAP